MAYEADTAIGGPQHGFPQTRPALVRQAAGAGDPAQNAVATVIEAYWKPAYKHIRLKWRYPNEEAKDLTQGFFATLLDSALLANFDPGRGSFRNYLRTCLDHFVLKERESAGRLKRGGDAACILDFDEAERELANAGPNVEEVFLHQWQRQTMELAVGDLRAHAARSGKQLHYRIFEQYDLADPAEGERPDYASLAAEHGIPVTTVTNHLAWARRELRSFALKRIS